MSKENSGGDAGNSEDDDFIEEDTLSLTSEELNGDVFGTRTLTMRQRPPLAGASSIKQSSIGLKQFTQKGRLPTSMSMNIKHKLAST